MTIAAETRKAGPFVGNGSATTFPFTFKVFTASDLLVLRYATATGVTSTLALTTDYTVTLNADQDASPGGSVVLNAVLATGYTLMILSAVPMLQGTDITNHSGVFPSVLTAVFDRLTILIQQLHEDIHRYLSGDASETTDMTLPTIAERANRYLYFDANGEPAAGALVTGTMPTRHSADVVPNDVRTEFGFTGLPAVGSYQLFVDGLMTSKGFTQTGDLLTFDAALPTGTELYAWY